MTDMLMAGRAVLASQSFSVSLGTELAAMSKGAAELRLPISSQLMQQNGFVHGGVVSYLADNALTFAAGSDVGAAVVTAEMKINYIRPAVGEVLIARAHTISAGRSQVVARCDIFVVAGGVEKLCAAAQGTIALVQP